jgi:hypothetical protein
LIYLLLSALGAALIAVGVALVSLPAGLVAGGAELLAAAYIGAYARTHLATPDRSQNP